MQRAQSKLLCFISLALLSVSNLGYACMQNGDLDPNRQTDPQTQPATTRAGTTTYRTTIVQTTRSSSTPRPTTTKLSSTTTTKRTTTSSTASETAACQAINCNFPGSTCSYTSGADSSSGTSWQTLSTRLGNRDTGVPGPPSDASQYAGTQVYPGERSVLQSAPFSLSGSRLLQFEYYESTENFVLKVCTNDLLSSCQAISNPSVDPTDRQWKKGSFTLPASAQQVQFLVENSGDNLGAAGIANVQLMRPSSTGGAPTPVCS